MSPAWGATYATVQNGGCPNPDRQGRCGCIRLGKPAITNVTDELGIGTGIRKSSKPTALTSLQSPGVWDKGVTTPSNGPKSADPCHRHAHCNAMP